MKKNMTQKVMNEISPYVKGVAKLVYEGNQKKIENKINELHDKMYGNGGNSDAMCEFFALTIVSRIVEKEKLKGEN